ncbi:glycosyltransferase [Candidatus Magnetomorum sp. HK-1]|nr:glycosyltransferase [Candidatus Magnetomorum sp. HK-1]
MQHSYCTCFDKNYLIKGIAFIESLQKHDISNFNLYVICIDDYTFSFLKKINYSNVILIKFSHIEQNNKELLNTKTERSPAEYIWTAKSSIISFLLNSYSHIEGLCYLDTDMFFFNSPDPIWKELDQFSVLIHEHRFVQEQAMLIQYGFFNAGFVCFRNDINGKKVLDWWRKKTLEWCFERVENGKYADQGYLNSFPEFKGVGIINHLGVGVAPWNHIQYQFSIKENDKVFVNEFPLIFYHFHSLLIDEPELILPATNTEVPFTINIISMCYVQYVEALFKSFQKIRSIQHDFTYGLRGKKIISEKHSFLAHKSIQHIINNIKISHKRINMSGNWDFYSLNQLKEECNNNSLVKTILSFSQKTADIILDEAEKELQKGNNSIAAQLLLKITEFWPKYYLAYNDLGIIHWKDGNKQQALKYMKYAYELNPLDERIVKNFSNILVKINEKKAAEDIISFYLRQFPKDSGMKNFYDRLIRYNR